MQEWAYLSANITGDEKRNTLVVTVLDGEFLFEKNDLSNCPVWIEFLAEKGKEGWELVGFTTGSVFGSWSAIFKRPIEYAVRPPPEDCLRTP